MPRRYCGSCRSPLHADDDHSECVSCLGKSHADAALAGSDCSHCESISLTSLRSRIAFFSESDPAPRALPFYSSQGPVRKKQRGRGSQRPVESELTPAQIPCASLSPASLFVSFGNRVKGHPVTKQRLSKWIVDAVMLAYSSLGLQCPIGVRAHSTRGIASSWAWSSGVSITEICAAAGWATPSTFARFYNLDIPTLQARVLSA